MFQMFAAIELLAVLIPYTVDTASSTGTVTDASIAAGPTSQ